MGAAALGSTGRRQDSSSRHFCVSATNKVRMLEDGVTDRIKTLLRSNMPPVQFKLLGTLRMMVDGQGKRQSAIVGGSGAMAPPFTALYGQTGSWELRHTSIFGFAVSDLSIVTYRGGVYW